MTDEDLINIHGNVEFFRREYCFDTGIWMCTFSPHGGNACFGADGYTQEEALRSLIERIEENLWAAIWCAEQYDT